MAELPTWQVVYDPDFIMDYQDTHYVVEMMIKPVQDEQKSLQDELEELKQKIKPDGSVIPLTDYSDLINKPKINGVEITGELTLSDLGVETLNNDDIDSIFN